VVWGSESVVLVVNIGRHGDEYGGKLVINMVVKRALT
jgi:hypothetical protein